MTTKVRKKCQDDLRMESKQRSSLQGFESNLPQPNYKTPQMTTRTTTSKNQSYLVN